MSTVDDARALRAILRSDFESFCRHVFNHLNPGTEFLPNWHVKSICWHLDQIGRGYYPRLLMTMPPRSGKSIAGSVAFPAWLHGHDPGLHIICASYAQELATKLQNDYRKVVTSKWYQALFPQTRISPRKDTEAYLELTAGGSRIATSIGGTLTGLGADVIIIDDPLKAGDAYSEARREGVNTWYSSTLLSRLNDKQNGRIVLISQRLHMNDLVGHVLAKEEPWETLVLPAIAPTDLDISVGDDRLYRFRKGAALHPAREPLAVLEALRREMGGDLFSAQYLQEPVPPGGSMFKRQWIQRYDPTPRQEHGDEVIQSWDTASKDGPANDWSVCTTWLRKDGCHYLLHVFRDRVDYPALRTSALQLGDRFKPRLTLIEDAGVGIALRTELRRAGLNTRAVTPRTSKEARASVQAAVFEGGRVFFPRQAPWLSELEAELFAFPGSRHDDQVDSISQALEYQRSRVISRTIAVPI